MASYGFTTKDVTQSTAQNPAAQNTLPALQCCQKVIKNFALEFFIPS